MLIDGFPGILGVGLVWVLGSGSVHSQKAIMRKGRAWLLTGGIAGRSLAQAWPVLGRLVFSTRDDETRRRQRLWVQTP